MQKKFAESKGVTFLKISEKDIAATSAKMQPIFAKYLEMTKTKGVPGDQALKFCQDFLKKNK